MDSKKLVWRRGSCDDDETCEACKKADGTVISGENENLGKVCTSKSGCRCIVYANPDEKAS